MTMFYMMRSHKLKKNFKANGICSGGVAAKCCEFMIRGDCAREWVSCLLANSYGRDSQRRIYAFCVSIAMHLV